MDSVRVDGFRIFVADGSRLRLARVGGTDQCTELLNSAVFFEDRRYDGAGSHELDQLAVKGTLIMHGVKRTGSFFAQTCVLHCHQFESAGEDVVEYSTRVAITHGIGLNHGECSIRCSHFENFAQT